MFQVANELITRSKGDLVYKDLVAIVAAPGIAAVSGASRFAEPLSVISDILKGADMKVLDPKDGNRMFNEAFRYVDNFLSTSDVAKYDAASGKRSPQLDKYFADRASKLTATERVLNLVGIDPWTLNESTDSAAANNIFVKYFHSFLEEESTKLMSNPKFRNGSLETRKVMWSDVKEQARKVTERWMTLKAGDEPRYQLIVDIHNSNKTKAQIAKAFEAIAPGVPIDDMNERQLLLVKEYLRTRDDFLRARDY